MPSLAEVEALGVFEMANTHTWSEWDLEGGLENIESQLALGTVRKVGTNIVATEVGMPDHAIKKLATYSIIEEGCTLEPHSRVVRSHVADSVIREYCTVTDSQVFESIISGTSKVTASSVLEGSVVDNTHVTDSTIYDYATITGQAESHIRRSEVSGLTLSGVVIEDATLTERTRNYIDVGNCIGLQNHVYAYFNKQGELRIKAGCQDFDSTAEMMATAERTVYYQHLPAATKKAYVQQVRAFAQLVNATARARKLN